MAGTLTIHIHPGGTFSPGHAYVSVTNNSTGTTDYSGYFPVGTDFWSNYDGPGEIRKGQTENNISGASEYTKTYNLNDVQLSNVQNEIARIEANPGNYNAVGNGRNCVDYAHQIMQAGQVGEGIADAFTDGQLYNSAGAGYYADAFYGNNGVGDMKALANLALLTGNPILSSDLDTAFSDPNFDWPFGPITPNPYDPGSGGPAAGGGGASGLGSALGGAIGNWLPFGDSFPFIPAVGPIGAIFNLFFNFPNTSPLILDLDLDGAIELTALTDTSTSFFDLDADGFVEQTGWVTSDDGLLAIDVNGDGVINDINELFGNATTDGFIELAALDSNSDGVINNLDTQFGDLLVWQDADGDGYSDAGELTSLASWNISSIDLNYTTVNGTNQGHDVSTQSTVSLSGGGSMLIQDIWFQHNQANSFYVVPDNFTYDNDVFELAAKAANDNFAIYEKIAA